MARTPNILDIDSIDYYDFWNYEMVRASGITNMYSPEVRDAIGIDRDTHFSIMHHYSALCEKYPDVRQLT